MRTLAAILAVMIIGASASGCAGGKMHYLPADSGKRHYPAATIHEEEVDPKVAIAYQTGRLIYREMQSWKKQCEALRSGAPVFTPTCREIIGDDRDIYRKYRGVLRDLNGY